MTNEEAQSALRLLSSGILLKPEFMREIEQIDSFLDSMDSYLHKASHLAELGVMSSMFAHEVNNLMTQVGGRAQLALMHMDEPSLVLKALQLSAQVSAQVAKLSEIFLESSRMDLRFQGKYEVREIHEQAITFISDEDVQRCGLELIETEPGTQIGIMPIVLQQVLLNLYLNAIRAIDESTNPNAGRIITRVERLAPGEGCSPWNMPRVRITVEDSGVGMSKEQIRRVFSAPTAVREIDAQDAVGSGSSAGATTKSSGRGHGLGLSICKRLLVEAGGSIACESTPGKGAKMIITLPTPEPSRAHDHQLQRQAA